MKYSIRFCYNSIASLTLKQKEFEVGSLFEIFHIVYEKKLIILGALPERYIPIMHL